jgi:hypothetical protein
MFYIPVSDKDTPSAQNNVADEQRDGNEPNIVVEQAPEVPREEQDTIAGASSSESGGEDGVRNEPTLRRSHCTRRKPDWYGNTVILGNQNADVAVSDPNITPAFSDWRDRVSILLTLMYVYPNYENDISAAIMKVISTV